MDTFWIKNEAPLALPPLSESLSADVVIVGAGITGLTTAYLLAKEKLNVVVVDDGPLANGESGRTTAHLTCMLDWSYTEIEKFHGEERARLAYESHAAAIDLIESIVDMESVRCDFKRVDGYLFLAPGDSFQTLEHEKEIMERIGFKDLELAPELRLPRTALGPCLRIPDQAQFHITRYLNGLANLILNRQGKIFTGSAIAKIVDDGVITADGIKITAPKVVIATHSPVEGHMIFVKQAPYRTYVVAGPIAKDSAPEALLWDTGDPYHYVRTQPLNERENLLIVGGEDHKTGQLDDYEKPFSNLEAWTKEHFPDIQRIQYRWSGQVLEPVDALAFIGSIPGHDSHYMATGFSGNGITYGTLSGMILRDLIMGQPNSWAEMYHPSRKNAKGLGEFVGENLNVLKRYTFDRIPHSKNEREKVSHLGLGEGAVIQKGLHKLAVYRDARGKLHAHSAVCTHLRCIVQWNDAEKTFDCPCHGSRFSGEGKVLCGPAIKDLPAWRRNRLRTPGVRRVA